jgi:hypothetical protein
MNWVNASRRGTFTTATWLIGLGVVFLVQSAMDWSWGIAWPLFVVLVGAAGVVSALLYGTRGLSGLWALTWPVAWIVVGASLLASTTGSLATGPGELISEYWPWALVVLGVWFVIGALVPGGRPVESLAIPLGGATRAAVRIKFGAGELVTRPAAPGNLVDGTFRGGVRQRLLGPGQVELSQDMSDGLPFVERGSSWDVGLTAEVPLDLRLDTGAYRGRIDLGELRVATLELHTGASETHIRLPRSAGATSVRAESGAASLTLEVPAGVAARVRARMALGSTDVDQARFPRVGDLFQSPDYETASNRVDIDAQGGVGSLRVIGGA